MMLFDLDGTLIDSNGIWLQIDLEFLARRSLPHTRAYSEAVSHLAYRDAAAYTKECFDLPESAEEILNIWSDMAYAAYAHTIPLKPGVLDYLRRCQAACEPMAIVTSCMDHLCHAVLERTGIRPFFSQITTVGEVNKGKEEPDLFLLAAQKAGVLPEACTVFEDSPVACRGARKAGMQVVGVFDPFYAAQAPDMRCLCHRYIQSFTELL